jgi:MtN3 and saliva related transmembrane protein
MESMLALSAAAWTIVMALGPVLQIRRIVDQQSSRGISISFFVVLLIGFGLWVAYGIAAANLALIVPNSVAAIVMVATIAVASRYRYPAVARGSEMAPQETFPPLARPRSFQSSDTGRVVPAGG